MKAKRLLILVMAICLTSGVRAQFYDNADDICYYVEVGDDGEFRDNGAVRIFNFDGRKAALLNFRALSDSWEWDNVSEVKKKIKSNPDYYEYKVENNEYDLHFSSSNSYVHKISLSIFDSIVGRQDNDETHTYSFSSDRKTCTENVAGVWKNSFNNAHKFSFDRKYKRVNKNYFKVGRSRTPSGTMYE